MIPASDPYPNHGKKRIKRPGCDSSATTDLRDEGMTEPNVRQQILDRVVFRMTIETIQGAAKSSQHRDDKNYQAIIAELNQ